MLIMKKVIIIIGAKFFFRESVPYCNPSKSSGKNKAKRYFRHSIQRSVPVASFSSGSFPIVFFL